MAVTGFELMGNSNGMALRHIPGLPTRELLYKLLESLHPFVLSVPDRGCVDLRSCHDQVEQ